MIIESAELIEPWIYSTLVNDSAFAATGLPVVGALTPDDPGELYVTISALSPPRDIRGVGLARFSSESVYLVKVVGRTTSQDDLLPAARRIFALFDGVEADTPNGHITCTRDQIVSYGEVSGAAVGGGQPYLHLGGSFRIRANS